MKENNKKQNIEIKEEVGILDASDTLNKEFRPDSLGEVIGQDAVIEVLLNSILYNEIPNSIMLQGPKGTGKTSTAKAYAKTLNCENVKFAIAPFISLIKQDSKTVINIEELKKVLRPCNHCLACEAFNKAPEYAGVIELDAGSQGKIGEVRDLKEKIRYSGDFDYKVVIIDEAHNMSNEGNTALLKTIEEPPKGVIFIFATTHPDDILPTIKSRSMKLKFNGVEDDLIENHLRYIASKKDIDISEKALKVLASTTDGGVRDAIKNLGHLSLKCKGRVIEVADLEDVVEIEPEYVDIIIDLMFNGTIDNLLSTLNKTFSSRKLSVENYHLDYFISKIRSKMYSAKTKEERKMLMDVYKIFISEKERFMYNVNPKTVIETAVIESFGLIEDFRGVDTSKSLEIKNDSIVVTKAEIFANVFKLMFDQNVCNIMFEDTDIIYEEEKDSLCFYMPNLERSRQAKQILKTDLAQSIKSIAGFKGFMVKIKFDEN